MIWLTELGVSANIPVLMIATTDHVTGSVGQTLSVELSKNGAPFSVITPTTTEVGYGWYNLTLSGSGHLDTQGPAILHVTSSGSDPTDLILQVGGPRLLSEEILKRDWTTISGEASRSVLNALRFQRNKFVLTPTTLTVYKENDTDTAWTAALTSSVAAHPVTGVDPD